MSATTLFKPCGIGNFEWLSLGRESTVESLQSHIGDAERLTEESGDGAIVLIAPADKVTLRKAEFDATEKKLLRQTLPYALEDELTEDVDSLHFALGEIESEQVDVALVRRDQLENWKDECAEQQLDVQAIVSEVQLLPWEDNTWTILIRDEQWLVRCGERKGFAIEVGNAGLALQLLMNESEQLPDRLLVYIDKSCENSNDSKSQVQQVLPELLKNKVEWREADYWQMIADGYASRSAWINLLQGEYALGLPWKKWWKSWKILLITLVAAILINILMSFTQVQVLESRNLSLRQQIEQTYRTVVPRGALLAPERQLQRKVNELKGSAGGAGFMRVFSQVAEVLGSVKGVQLQGVNYTEAQSEIRLTIVADSFRDVETIRSGIEQLGLKAELTGSSSEDSKTRARIRVRG